VQVIRQGQTLGQTGQTNEQREAEEQSALDRTAGEFDEDDEGDEDEDDEGDEDEDDEGDEDEDDEGDEDDETNKAGLERPSTPPQRK
jgi:hypothetical protein